MPYSVLYIFFDYTIMKMFFRLCYIFKLIFILIIQAVFQQIPKIQVCISVSIHRLDVKIFAMYCVAS